jgi:hypothetical protein
LLNRPSGRYHTYDQLINPPIDKAVNCTSEIYLETVDK